MRSFYLPLGLAAVCIQPLSVAAQADLLPALPAEVHSFHAQPLPTQPLAPARTLATAIQQALLANPDLQVAAQDVGIAEGGIVQAGARPNPELALLAEGLQKENRTTTVQLNQVLETGGKRSLRIAAAERDRDAAVADLAIRRAEVRAAVIAAFFDVLVAQQRLQLAETALQLSQQAAGVTARRVIAGKISPVEETRARVALAESGLEQSQAMAELDIARRRLAASCGASSVDFLELAEPGKPFSAEQSLAALNAGLANAPQLVRARLEIERQHAQVALERSRRIPDLTLSLGSKRDEQAGRSQTVIGLSLPLPLLDTNRGNLLTALRKADKARDELAAIEQRLALELAIAFRRHAQAQAELHVLRSDVLPGAQSAYTAAIKGFELGKFNFLEVLDAQRTLFRSKSLYLRSLAESYRAHADIGRITGLDQTF
ncbi:TolC family protein [Undibacterium sp. TJN25]|uniref:TolC family protein n=1 Tax=Undibacterium sp. TJN25 TaxID=3413056 RepID=UPI003BF2C237